MARLKTAHPYDDPGLRRIRSGDSFRYSPGGGRISSTMLERIEGLAIPPAWEDVWIALEDNAHIQAVGTDAAGRRQYVYHPRWRARRDDAKFDRAIDLADALPSARARVTRALRDEGPTRGRALAVALRLLDTVAPRIGSERYFARNGSRGLTTLQRRDADVTGTETTLCFPAKSGHRAQLHTDDVDLARVVDELRRGRPRAALLWHRRGRRQAPLTPDDVNSYLRDLTGHPFTAKDFRTLRGTIAAAEALARIGQVDRKDRKDAVRFAVRATADQLGNTPAVARDSYIDPRVFRRYEHGELLDLTISPESAIRRLVLRE